MNDKDSKIDLAVMTISTVAIVAALLMVMLSGCGGVSLHVHSDEVRLDDLTKRVSGLEAKQIDPKSLGEAFKDHEGRLLKLEAKPTPTATPK